MRLIVYQSMMRKAKIEQGCCARCSENNPDLLEFAHWNRNNKCKVYCSKSDKYYTYKSLARLPLKSALTELMKGRFLCICCHRTETFHENARSRTKTLLSLETKGNNHSSSKYCSRCKCSRSVDFFFKNRRACKLCDYTSKMNRCDTKRNFINAKKVEYGQCAVCGWKVCDDNAYLFDWDHLKTKNVNVSELVWQKEKKIVDEIKLCQLLCCKCHRLKSNQQARKNGSE